MQPKPKPIRRTAFGITSRTNVPYSEPLTPGLRRPISTQAIGFHTDYITVRLDPPALRDSVKWAAGLDGQKVD